MGTLRVCSILYAREMKLVILFKKKLNAKKTAPDQKPEFHCHSCDAKLCVDSLLLSRLDSACTIQRVIGLHCATVKSTVEQAKWQATVVAQHARSAQ